MAPNQWFGGDPEQQKSGPTTGRFQQKMLVGTGLFRRRSGGAAGTLLALFATLVAFLSAFFSLLAGLFSLTLVALVGAAAGLSKRQTRGDQQSEYKSS